MRRMRTLIPVTIPLSIAANMATPIATTFALAGRGYETETSGNQIRIYRPFRRNSARRSFVGALTMEASPVVKGQISKSHLKAVRGAVLFATGQSKKGG